MPKFASQKKGEHRKTIRSEFLLDLKNARAVHDRERKVMQMK